MTTVGISARIRLDQAVEVEKRNINISEFLRNKLDEEFKSGDFISVKEKELKNELKKLKNLKKEEKSKEIPKVEKEFLLGARKRVQSSPGELQENCRVYNQKFNKKISVEKFKELIK